MKNMFDVVKKGMKAIINVIPDVDVLVKTVPSRFQGQYINKVFINSQEVDGIDDCREISIVVHGNAKRIDLAAGNIDIAGNVEGNVKTGAGNIGIEGDVHGDLDASCGNIEVQGKVSGNVHASCGNVTIG